MDEAAQRDWQRCVDFHGHTCPGLAIGFQVAQMVIRLWGALRSADEELVCVTENDACGVDAIQVLLGCSAGKGNLLFRLRGKSAYSFYQRGGKSVRLVLGERPQGMTREESLAWLLERDPAELYRVGPVHIPLPERAPLFASHVCARCGELTAEPWLRLVNDEKVCLDCNPPRERVCIG
ncbi:MAG: formylmethanofuran dehydrogenase [Chloroflexi bacterium]|nr:formylmethanofuran dehydrogenase [Chloroflexota bacterium]